MIITIERNVNEIYKLCDSSQGGRQVESTQSGRQVFILGEIGLIIDSQAKHMLVVTQ